MWHTDFDILETGWTLVFFLVLVVGVTAGLCGRPGRGFRRRTWTEDANPDTDASMSQQVVLCGWIAVVVVIAYANQEALSKWSTVFMAQITGQTKVTEGVVQNYSLTHRGTGRHASVTETFSIGHQIFQLEDAVTISPTTGIAQRTANTVTYLESTGRSGITHRRGMHAKVWHDGSRVAKLQVRK